MAEVYSMSKARRRERSPRLPMPDSLLITAETFGFPLPETFNVYYLRRTRRGTEVSIRGGPLTINLSYYTKTYPNGFKEARKWIAAVADRHGWCMVEGCDPPSLLALTPA